MKEVAVISRLPHASPRRSAFTLVEILVALGTLSLIVVLASQMTAATLSTVSRTTHTLDSSEAVRATTMLLRDELAGVLANNQPDRFLNLKVVSDESGVTLYFTVPRVQTTELARMGFVTHVAYVWDREARIFYRAEYNSSRDVKAVDVTARSANGTDSAGNLSRLRRLTPSYDGKSAYAWTSHELWTERLKLAKKNPLLTGVHDWKVECFASNNLDSEKPEPNLWEDPGKLPVALRLGWVVRAQRRSETDAKALGRRYESIIPLAAVEAEK